MNELEILLSLMEYMILKKMEENPNGGIKKNATVKMKYKQMLFVLKGLRIFINDWCSVKPYNICKECDNCVVDEAGTGHYGNCHAKDRDQKTSVHLYHTCFRNTATRWNRDKSRFDYPSEEGHV